jgi:hypothetical protein
MWPMSDDSEVPKLSDREIRARAQECKKAYGTEKRRPVNIIKCLQSGWIPTRYGRKKLTYRLVDDEDLGTKDGRTEFAGSEVIITIKRSVHDRAFWGDGRSRMTLAHELAHGVLHSGVPMYRATGASGTTELSRITAAASAEHQAKVFASAFLIHDEVVVTLRSPADVSEQFLVSLEAAEICFERVTERERAKEHIRQVNERFQGDMQPRQQQHLAYSEKRCPECQRQMLLISFGFLCFQCGYSDNSE